MPAKAEVLVNHIPPHGYGNNWSVEYPLVRLRVGQGSIIVSTMNFASAAEDPLAARSPATF